MLKWWLATPRHSRCRQADGRVAAWTGVLVALAPDAPIHDCDLFHRAVCAGRTNPPAGHANLVRAAAAVGNGISRLSYL